MSDDAALKQLIKDVRYLKDRQDILDCVNVYSRGLDRHDVEILLKAYHADAVDEHGKAINGMPEYPEWVNAMHASRTKMHNHNITTHNCEIDGDVAHAESYVLCGLALKDSNDVWLGCGRYIDRLERRDGVWKIAMRRTMMDWMFTADGGVFEEAWYKAEEYPEGTRDSSDISYLRPLRLNGERQARAEAISAEKRASAIK
jgi:ketosteroid isomerase-like protein